MTRLFSLIAAAALMLPSAALAAEGCGARIAAIESHPALSEQEMPAEETSGSSNEGEVQEQTDNGEAIEENGGTTVYQEGGPAAPRESWFADLPDKAKVIEHLEAAKEARDAGDPETCLQEVQQAEKIMSDETKKEQEQNEQSETQSD